MSFFKEQLLPLAHATQKNGYNALLDACRKTQLLIDQLYPSIPVTIIFIADRLHAALTKVLTTRFSSHLRQTMHTYASRLSEGGQTSLRLTSPSHPLTLLSLRTRARCQLTLLLSMYWTNLSLTNQAISHTCFFVFQEQSTLSDDPRLI